MRNLLIVDDQAGIRLLLEEIFRQEGHRTRIAINGLQALQEVENEIPDCVLLDMNMPGLNGQEVLERLKSRWPDIPVVMMTAYGESEMINKLLSMGAKDCFTKPFDIYELSDAVNDILRN